MSQPIYLFADSQLLFWSHGDGPFLSSVRKAVTRKEPKAAYIGASNEDRLEYFSIFEGAMDLIGIRDRRMNQFGLPGRGSDVSE